MDKKFCDRCGKEIQPKTLFFCNKSGFKEVWLRSDFILLGNSSKRYELCHDCLCELKKFLNDPTYHNKIVKSIDNDIDRLLILVEK